MSKRNESFRGCLAAAVVALFLASSLPAQVTSGTIAGTVADETGAVLPGVEVVITNTETGVSRTVLSSDVGLYRAPNLIPGPYEVSASLAGFRAFRGTGLNLTVGQEMRVNVTLQIGEITEEVTVTGAGQLVNTTSATMQELVDEVKVRELPLNGRDYVRLSLLQPGVLQMKGQRQTRISPQTGTGLNVSISGGRPNSNVFRLDGIVINDHANASPGSIGGANLGVDSIREFSTLTNTYPAEYGRSSGGVVNAVLRSGTNDYHGSLFWFHRNDELDARDFFDIGEVPEFRRHQFGFTGGGPISRDRSFLFGSYEGLREFRNLTTSAVVPTAAAKAGNLTGPDLILGTADDITVPVDPAIPPVLRFYPDPNGQIIGDQGTFFSAPGRTVEADFMTLRGDHQFTEKAFMHASYLVEDAFISSINRHLTVDTLDTSRRQFITSEFTYLASPRVINSLRVGYNRSNLVTGFFQARFPELDTFNPELSFLPGRPMGTLVIAGFSDFQGGSESEDIDAYLFESFQVYEDVNITSGKHDFKFGFALEVIRDRGQATNRKNGELSYDSLQDLLTNGTPSLYRGQLPGSDDLRFFSQEIYGFYGQDRIQLTDRFSLDLGLRWEVPTNIVERNGKESKLVNHTLDAEVTTGDGFFDIPQTNISPRIGFAWDLFGNGKTAIRGGFGLFNELHMVNLLTIPALRMPPFFLRSSLSQGLPSGGFPGEPFRVFSEGASAGILSLDPVNTNPSTAYRMQYNLNIQHELAENTVLTVGYVGGGARHLTNVIGDSNLANHTIEDGRVFFPFAIDTPLGFDQCPGGALPAGGYPTLASVLSCTPVAGFTGQEKRNPNFARIGLRDFNADSFYNGLQIGVNRRFTEDFRVQGAYTWSKAMDHSSATFSENQFQNGTGPSYPFLTDDTLSVAEFDVRQVLVINGTYDLPGNVEGGLGKLLNGWQIGGIGQFTSGTPFTVRQDGGRAMTLTERRGSLNSDRPDLAPGGDQKADPPSGADKTLAFDPTQFAPVIPGVLGNVGRNTVTGPGYNSIDLVLTKNTYVPSISEDFNIQFRAEFFNAFNRTNFDIPESNRFTVFNFQGVQPADPGRMNSTIIKSREIQLGLKIIF